METKNEVSSMTNGRKLYVASPLGFSEVGREFMYGRLLPEIQAAGYVILDPWKLTPDEELQKVMRLPYGPAKKAAWQRLNQVIGKNNVLAIQNADGLFAVLDGVDVDSGTAAEIGYAAAQGKPCVAYRGDFRLAADNEGSVVNLQVEHFIKMNGGEIVSTLKDIRLALQRVFGAPMVVKSRLGGAIKI